MLILVKSFSRRTCRGSACVYEDAIADWWILSAALLARGLHSGWVLSARNTDKQVFDDHLIKPPSLNDLALSCEVSALRPN
jgi:hypothetical protein